MTQRMTESGPGAAVELLTIGNELLLGETVDHNAAWLGRTLAQNGFRVIRSTTVGDDEAAIRDALDRALDRTATVLCTGGLGPTHDDVTRAAVAAYFGRPLVIDPDLLASIRDRFTARGFDMPEINRVQAEVPAGATVLPNRRGTAPGIAIEDDDGRLAVLLPGVPTELHTIVHEHLLSFLLARAPVRAKPIRHRVVRTTGVPESTLSERIAPLIPSLEPLSLASLPSAAGVDLRLTSWGALAADEVDAALDRAAKTIEERIGAYVYGRDQQDLADVIAHTLSERRLTLALAESCTGGLVAKRLTDVPGASAFLVAGLVPYADQAKERLLGVRRSTLEQHGAVSEQTAREMARGARATANTDAAVAITGIAGPTGGTPAKPVGTVWIAADVNDYTEARHYLLPGDREEIRERTAQAAFALLWSLIRDGQGWTSTPEPASF